MTTLPTSSTSGDNQLPAHLRDAIAEDIGRGVSDQSADFAMQQLQVGQVTSPLVDKNDAAYVDGAEAGDLVLRDTLHPVYKGDEGLTVIHCGQITAWSEFLKGRQGFAGRHLECPDDVESRPADNGSKYPVLVRRSSGNVIVETREIYLLAEGTPCVLFCSGTKHRFAKRWMAWMAQFKAPDGRPLPSFSRRYRLVTVPTKNPLGKWYGLDFQDLGWTPLDQYQAARTFNKLVEGGGLRVAPPNDNAA